jgi:hypothetical protein
MVLRKRYDDTFDLETRCTIVTYIVIRQQLEQFTAASLKITS